MSSSRRDTDFDKEIEAHIALEADQLVAEGASPDDARAQAQRRFGNVTAARERFYDTHRILWLDTLRQDLRIALRSSLRDRGVVLVALLTLAIGIGATTAIVSTVNAVLLRPLPYANPDRLATIWEDMTETGFRQNTPAPGNYFDWMERNRVFDGMAATVGARANITGGGAPERVLGRRVTANFFDVLGVRPLIGRTFTEEEDRQNAPVVVIAHTLWQRRYAGDPAIVGRQLTMNGAAATVLGVMPASFVFRDREMEFWSPAAFTPQLRALRTAHILTVVGRLKPGVEFEAARADMNRVAADLRREYVQNAGVGVALVPIRDEVFGATRQQLIVLAVAAGCLLLLMSANLANLLLARAAARRRELATRAALGAGRIRLAVQMISEGLVWSLVGGVVGIGVAVAGLRVLNALIPVSLAEEVAPNLDLRLLTVALGVALVTGIGVSLAPAFGASRVSVSDVLKATGGGLGGGWHTRSALIALQVAATFALLVGAGLMVQSFANLRGTDLGFRPAGVLTANTALPPARYDMPRRTMFYDRVVSELQRVPGVESAGFISTLPFLSRGNTSGYRVEGITVGNAERVDALFRVTTNDYLKTMGATLLAGRLPDRRDAAGTPPIVVVNESFVARHFPRGDALGHRLATTAGNSPWMTIVGVVADMREAGYEIAVKPGLYILASQVDASADNLVVRVAGDPLAIASAVREIVSRVDPEQPVAAVRTMDAIVALDTIDRRQQSIILTAFALTALLLASIGIYGLVSFSVTVRRREVGLRTALGGSVGDVTRSLVRHGLILVAVGLATGLMAALAGTRIMEGLLFGIAPKDPPTFAAIAALVLAISALACWLPAWRAARMSPMTALRQE